MSFSQTLVEVSLQSEKKFQMGVFQGGELAGVEISSFLGYLCLCPGGHPSAPNKWMQLWRGQLVSVFHFVPVDTMEVQRDQR